VKMNMILEYEVYVAKDVYAYDDGGNRGDVGKRYEPGTYGIHEVPKPPGERGYIPRNRRREEFGFGRDESVARRGRLGGLAEDIAGIVEARPPKGMEGEPQDVYTNPLWVANRLTEAQNAISEAAAAVIQAQHGASIIPPEGMKLLERLDKDLIGYYKDLHAVRQGVERKHNLWDPKAVKYARGG